MSMYECTFCGSDNGGFPEVIVLINTNLNNDIPSSSDWETIFDKIWLDVKINTNFIFAEEHTILDAVWREFYNEIHKHDLWFCTKKCAEEYLKYGKSQWRLEEENNKILEEQILNKKPGER